MTTMTTDMMTRSLLGRAREASMRPGAVPARSVAYAHDQIGAAPASVGATTRTHETTVATNPATNPWLGGFGTGSSICSMTVVDDSTKRIHPGRLEGVT